MDLENGDTVAVRAKAFYFDKLQKSLEAAHFDRFVAIEPESGNHFLGDSFIEAALSAKQAHPDRESFVIRIGHDTAFHIGASSS